MYNVKMTPIKNMYIKMYFSVKKNLKLQYF